MKLFVLLLSAAVLAFASSAVVVQSPKDDFNAINGITKDVSEEKSTLDLGDIDNFDDDEILDDEIIDDADDSDDEYGPDEFDDDTEIDGIPLRHLSTEEIYDLLEDEDNMFISEIDIIVAQKIVKARQDKGTISDDVHQVSKGSRHRRWVPVAIRLFQAGRTLFRASRAGRVTSSGSRVTRQYQRPGNVGTANRDFDRFRVDNPSSFSGRVNGRTGTVGNHRVTVRDGSSNGSPTLEIRSPRPNGGEYVRKFRYNE